MKTFGEVEFFYSVRPSWSMGWSSGAVGTRGEGGRGRPPSCVSPDRVEPQRPLTADMLVYAGSDTAHLPALRDLLQEAGARVLMTRTTDMTVPLGTLTFNANGTLASIGATGASAPPGASPPAPHPRTGAR